MNYNTKYILNELQYQSRINTKYELQYQSRINTKYELQY